MDSYDDYDDDNYEDKYVRGYVGGYDWEAGKSARAVAAEAAGLLTASQLGQLHRVSAAAVEHVLPPVEWHHTSKFYNATYYYNPDEVTPELIEKMREFDRRRKEEKKPVAIADCTIEWVEWEGSRRRPRPIKCKAEHVPATKKGDWIIFDHRGKTLRKKLTGAHISVTYHDDPAVVSASKAAL